MPSLVDSYGRPIDYLRISMTDRCNMRCFYCMSESGVKEIPHDDILRYEELLKVVETAQRLDFKRFRITGGEPLARRGILWFLEELSKMEVNYSITTNALLLAKFAKDLKKAGLRRINVGLDTLDKDKFLRITRREGLKDVLKGIDAARAAGISEVKVNMVVMRGVNDDEIEGFLNWARRERLTIRFIEFMPVYGKDLFVSLKPFIDSFRLREEVEAVEESGGGPSKSFQYRDGGGKVGFILPRTEPFCSGCNRLRLTADGKLLTCLFSKGSIDLRTPLRSGGDIEAVLIKAVRAKPEGHKLDMKLHQYGMYSLGG